MAAADPAIRFEGVTKWYLPYRRAVPSLKGALLRPSATARALRDGRLVALDDVSFEVAWGETVGVIGPNGAGKSTLLGLVAGVLHPQQGRVLVQGRVCPLLELGAGFHPELSGRENVLVNGVLLGLSRRQVLERMADVVAFSELDAFFLDQPIRTYSSGMVARLGFAVAAHVDADVLLVDEVFAVGDAGYQTKCRSRMLEFRAQGVTTLFVSHSMEAVAELCDRVLWLEGGRIVRGGDSRAVIDAYLAAHA